MTVLTDLINQTIGSSGLFHYSLIDARTNNSVLDSPINFIPLWKQRQLDEELRLARIQRGAGEPIDLGLSVKWSNKNLGAPSIEQPGYYVGWGDVTCQNASTFYGDYPCVNNICGSQYDAVHHLWAETWRLPTNNEMIELMQKCQWVWTIINGVPGFQITGSTGNSIFLPAGGNRYGLQYEDAYYFGRYWTGEIDPTDNTRAFFLEFSQQNGQLYSLSRSLGMLIRPVLG